MDEKFNIGKKGYDTTEVNTYIETLEGVINSYKEKDNTIKNAILNAQIAADNIVQNAELEAQKIVAKSLDALDEISNSITSQKQLVAEFQAEYNNLISKYIHKFNDNDMKDMNAKITELEQLINKVKSSNQITTKK